MGTSSTSPGPRRFVVGTAGHIDHGKTALVKALTGVDTDRWEEEKRRGITIDLGFAPLPLTGDVEASIVDVPGHEGFVRNMLAGATGIDVVLLVVAADEGFMPQTEEHLAIVELLGVARGIPVITRQDLVEPDQLERVRHSVTERLRASRVHWEPAAPVSAVTGAGLDELRAALTRAAGEIPERVTDDLFRLPIDRAFSLPGAGTVVTGSTRSGTVAVGDTVRLLPLDRVVRVRSIQVHNHDARRAYAGRRTALALVGVERTEVRRGDVAVTGPGWTPSCLLDAAVEILPRARHPLVAGTRVRVHLGTAEVLARAEPEGEIAPGGCGIVRLILESPLVARGQDRFVLRSLSPVATIGGGVVLDPAPVGSAHVRGLVAQASPADRVARWAEESGLTGLAIDSLPVRLGIPAPQVSDILRAAGSAVVGCERWIVARAAIHRAVARLGEALREYHERRPLAEGMPLEECRATIGLGDGEGKGGRAVGAPVIEAVLASGSRERLWEISGSVIYITGWRPAVDSVTQTMRRAVLARLVAARWQLPTLEELERSLGPSVRGAVAGLVREGLLEQIDRERCADPEALRAFEAALEVTVSELGAATPAQIRDRLGLSRKYLIPLLEWADRRGLTRRRGDVRTLVRLTARSANH